MDDAVPRSILVIVLIILGGFFSGAETAYSYCNKIRIKKKADDGDRRAARVEKILDRFDNLLTTLLVGTNVCHVFASASAALLFVKLMGTTGAVVSTVIMTLLIFLFSETIPKSVARANADAYATAVSLPVMALMFLLTPLNLLFRGIGGLIKLMFPKREEVPSITEDEFSTIVENVRDEGLIEPEESELIKSAIEFSDTEVREVMHPLSEMVAVDIKTPEEEVERLILEQKYSRLPVYAGSRDRIIGVLCVKDCLPKYIRGAKVDTGKLMKLPYLISPETKLDQAFEGLGRRRTHLAVVTDENGCAVGFITMEDIMEEIVGEIYDEDDVVRPARNEAAT